MNQFEIRDRCIEFVTNNAWLPDNNVQTKLDLKVEEICRDCPKFLRDKWQSTRILISFIRGIFMTLWNTQYETFCKNSPWLNIVNYFYKKIRLICFTGISIVSDNPVAFSIIIINWCCHFGFFRKFSNLISIFTMANRKGFYWVVLSSLLIKFNIFIIW